MILIIDNYDSFTFNLVQLVAQQTSQYHVIRNDAVTISETTAMKLDGILISPGPGTPEQAGICVKVIQLLGKEIPILGVCLGHQAIGYAFGARIIHAPSLMHGKISPIHHAGFGVFHDLPSPFEATRYHSLIIDSESVTNDLEITAMTHDRIVMGIRHKHYPIEGIQFHPESILTTVGPQLIRNWLSKSARLP